MRLVYACVTAFVADIVNIIGAVVMIISSTGLHIDIIVVKIWNAVFDSLRTWKVSTVTQNWILSGNLT